MRTAPVEFGMHGFLCYCEDDVFDRLADLTLDAGFLWLREGFPWRHDDGSGPPDWDRMDRRIDALVGRGFKILGLVGAGSNMWPDGTHRTMPDDLGAWETWVRRVVDRFGDRVSAWEVHNEPNYERFWLPEPDPKEYATLLASTYTTIRSTGHDGPIVSMSLAFCDLEFLDQVLAAGGAGYADVVSVHPYSIWGAPEPAGVRDGTAACADVLRAHGVTPRLWVTEIGWSTWPTGLFSMSSEQAVSDYQTRAHVLLSTVPEVETVFVHTLRDGTLYPLRDDLAERQGAEFMDHLGIVNQDTTPKLPYHAARATIAELGGLCYDGALPTWPGVYAHVFTGPGRRTVVTWTSGDVGTVLIPCDRPTVTVTDVTGRSLEVRVDDGMLDLRAGPSPMFARLEG